MCQDRPSTSQGDSGLMLGTAEQSIGTLPCRGLAAVRIRFRKKF
jgi:hypothetical protein